MELPGQISDTRLDLQVYVDQSGSISDALLRQLLAQAATLTQLLTATITIKPFDAIVQPGQTYQVVSRNRCGSLAMVAGERPISRFLTT
jgi:predicted metal-dependent peptidase